MDIEQIKDLMNHLEKSSFRKLIYKVKDFELHLEKGAAHPQPPRAEEAPGEDESAFQSDFALKGERGGAVHPDAPGTFVTSPMVGTFFAAPSPDQPTFVKVGDKVDEDTVVCIVEAMKVMNEVKAGMSGTVAEALAQDSEPVEFGTRLFRIT